jgi:hypothetical protein
MKTKKPRSSSVSAANAGLTPAHQEIASRAEALWREKGCPQGCDEKIWLEAEQELRRRLSLDGDERDKAALADFRFPFNRGGNDLMEELDERFPGSTGKETTSL